MNGFQNSFNNPNNFNNFNYSNNSNNFIENQNSPDYQRLYDKFQELLERAEKHLSDTNNVNHYLYEQYYSNFQNTNQNNSTNQKTIIFSGTESTQDPNVNKLITLEVTEEYKEEYVDNEKISSGEEKRTAVKISGTSLPKQGGEYILKFLENLKLGMEDGQPVYDIVYLPKQKEKSNNSFFMVNFRNSSHINNFCEAMKESIDKKEANEIIFSWYKKQGDILVNFLRSQKSNKKCKDFIYFMDD